MVDFIMQIVLVVSDVWLRLVSTDSDAVMMSFAPFTSQSYVIDTSRVIAEISRKMKRQVMNGVEFHNLKQ